MSDKQQKWQDEIKMVMQKNPTLRRNEAMRVASHFREQNGGGRRCFRPYDEDCNNSIDPITLDNFKESTEGPIIRLHFGEFTECHLVEPLYEWLYEQIYEGRVPKNIKKAKKNKNGSDHSGEKYIQTPYRSEISQRQKQKIIKCYFKYRGRKWDDTLHYKLIKERHLHPEHYDELKHFGELDKFIKKNNIHVMDEDFDGENWLNINKASIKSWFKDNFPGCDGWTLLQENESYLPKYNISAEEHLNKSFEYLEESCEGYY